MEVRQLWETPQELFNFDYKFYTEDETIKTEFEQKFYDYYYFNEIGFETDDRFIKVLQTKLNLLQPKYEHLYETLLYEYEPLENYNVNENITTSGTSETTGSGSNFDTPINPKSNYEKTPSFISENENAVDTTTVQDRTTTGNIGVQTSQDLIVKERNIIINIDMMIIQELEHLFMGVL